MTGGKAPRGHYTEINIKANLKNGRQFERSWETPSTIPATYHRALKWLIEEMRELEIEGRSNIVRVRLDVRYVPGVYGDENAVIEKEGRGR